jgi:metallophosphoesterase (TIGR00282 family)
MSASTCILFIGDVVGGLGKRTLLALLPELRERHAPDFVVVNGENVAGGVGITPRLADEMFAAGVHVITLGNHTYRHREVYGYLDDTKAILRPANYLRSQPGHGFCVVEREGVRLGVISLSGNLFMNASRPAFVEADTVLASLKDRVDHVLVDMHAEATSEKVGLGWHLDGRVTAVVGTHTHVPTADGQILPGGTAYQTDAGACADYDSVIGNQKEEPLRRFTTRISGGRFKPAEGPATVCGVYLETDPATGLARRIEPIRVGGRLSETVPSVERVQAS